MKGERTCIGCRDKETKSKLYRIVRTPDGDVAFDPTGRAAGRGAYVCSLECFDKVESSGRLTSALRVKASKDSIGAVRAQFENAMSVKGKKE